MPTASGRRPPFLFAGRHGRKPTVVIGKDTRISSDMLEAALTAGLTACGCNVVTPRRHPDAGRGVSDGSAARGRGRGHLRIAQSV
ncbi:MAG: hypothetical protein V8T01_01550 [Oscillospiraceae bacterium]